MNKRKIFWYQKMVRICGMGRYKLWRTKKQVYLGESRSLDLMHFYIWIERNIEKRQDLFRCQESWYITEKYTAKADTLYKFHSFSGLYCLAGHVPTHYLELHIQSFLSSSFVLLRCRGISGHWSMDYLFQNISCLFLRTTCYVEALT